jgi:hypothetical protein
MTYPPSGKVSIGARVRLRDLDSVPDELRGSVGTITRSFGHLDHAAHEVVLEGGSSQLFWHYQLRDEVPK